MYTEFFYNYVLFYPIYDEPILIKVCPESTMPMGDGCCLTFSCGYNKRINS